MDTKPERDAKVGVPTILHLSFEKARVPALELRQPLLHLNSRASLHGDVGGLSVLSSHFESGAEARVPPMLQSFPNSAPSVHSAGRKNDGPAWRQREVSWLRAGLHFILEAGVAMRRPSERYAGWSQTQKEA